MLRVRVPRPGPTFYGPVPAPLRRAAWKVWLSSFRTGRGHLRPVRVGVPGRRR